jgi:hypothetical protein
MEVRERTTAANLCNCSDLIHSVVFLLLFPAALLQTGSELLQNGNCQ